MQKSFTHSPMVNGKQLARLLGPSGTWNAWRTKNPGVAIDLEGARLSAARLAGKDLNHAALIEADLIGANLERANLHAASLVGACCLGASLSKACLKLADLRAADLRGADLSGAALAESLFVTQAQLDSADGDGETTLPAYLSRPRHWTQPSADPKRP